MISGSSEANRRKQRHEPLQSRIAGSDAQLYKELAQASGGQAIEVATGDLAAAIGLITQLSSSASLVIPPKPEVGELPRPDLSGDL